jgi:hypothetical protein
MGGYWHVRQQFFGPTVGGGGPPYRPQLIGVTMHRPDESAYHDASAWVIDDWR